MLEIHVLLDNQMITHMHDIDAYTIYKTKTYAYISQLS